MTTATANQLRARLAQKSDAELDCIERSALYALESVSANEMSHPAARQQIAIRDACRAEFDRRYDRA